MIFYAQNFEDVSLWRAFGNIQQGKYIDIGAQHPIIDSVSRVFYEQGWRGIHIEPVPAYAEMLRNYRSGEQVISDMLQGSTLFAAANPNPSVAPPLG